MDINHLIVNSSIARGLDVVGDRWSLLILRDAFLGRRRFEEFRRYTGASRATLSRRLNALVDEGVLYKQAYGEGATRFEYRLSDKGVALFPVSLLAWQWELEWGGSEYREALPYTLIHQRCGQALKPSAVCGHCQQEIALGELDLPETALDSQSQLAEIKSLSRQRRVRASQFRGDEDLTMAGISDLIGDRWTLLILICAFFGARRYDGFLRQLGIASNILTARLNLLSEVGVFERYHYQDKPPRSEYRLSAKGLSLYPIIIALRQWAVDWRPAGEVMTLRHKRCGKPLVLEVQCGSCGDAAQRREVEFALQAAESVNREGGG
ncbi:winged helix-turn-helix transcriptional regulator [Spongiibacter sp.]|uniref:winged helix-turn-helix transcriptional regulator n=1 Tax=Spongiibacter sp. TaxID=2024860 RepID=UPI003561C476